MRNDCQHQVAEISGTKTRKNEGESTDNYDVMRSLGYPFISSRNFLIVNIDDLVNKRFNGKKYALY